VPFCFLAPRRAPPPRCAFPNRPFTRSAYSTARERFQTLTSTLHGPNTARQSSFTVPAQLSQQQAVKLNVRLETLARDARRAKKTLLCSFGEDRRIAAVKTPSRSNEADLSF